MPSTLVKEDNCPFVCLKVCVYACVCTRATCMHAQHTSGYGFTEVAGVPQTHHILQWRDSFTTALNNFSIIPQHTRQVDGATWDQRTSSGLLCDWPSSEDETSLDHLKEKSY